MKRRSDLEIAVLAAVEAKRELDDPNDPLRRISATAYVAEACAIAEIDPADLDALEEVYSEPRAEELRKAMRRHRAALERAGRPSLMTRAFGFAHTEESTAQCGGHFASVQAVVARQLAREKPKWFGRAESTAAAYERDENLRDAYREALEVIRRTATLLDLQPEFLSPELRAGGYCRMWFKEWPTVAFTPEFGERLVEAELAGTAKAA